jgi:hypothetical protein
MIGNACLNYEQGLLARNPTCTAWETSFKHWRPFHESPPQPVKKDCPDDAPLTETSTGIVKRMISSLSSQLNLNNDHTASTSSNSSVALRKVTAQHKRSRELSGSTSSVNFRVEETVSGIQIQIKQPHLIWVRVRSQADDEATNHAAVNKTSIKIYPLKTGRTSIGSAHSNDIVIEGAGIEAEHCFVENALVTIGESSCSSSSSCESSQHSDSSSSSISSYRAATTTTKRVNLVTLFPIGRLCAVDGVVVDAPYMLHSGRFI